MRQSSENNWFRFQGHQKNPTVFVTNGRHLSSLHIAQKVLFMDNICI
jgi:hypothetical protein